MLVRCEAERPQGHPAAGGRGRCAHLRRRRSRSSRPRSEHASRGSMPLRATPDGRRRGSIDVWARVVVLAGSAVGSAALARRSGLPDPNDQLGRGPAHAPWRGRCRVTVRPRCPRLARHPAEFRVHRASFARRRQRRARLDRPGLCASGRCGGDAPRLRRGAHGGDALVSAARRAERGRSRRDERAGRRRCRRPPGDPLRDVRA